MNVTEKLAQLVLSAQRANKRTIDLDDLVTLLIEAHLPEAMPTLASDRLTADTIKRAQQALAQNRAAEEGFGT